MDQNDIIQNSQNISLENVNTAKTEFCFIWPKVKEGLQVLQGIIKNPIAKATIGIVIAAGDAVSKSICGN